MVPWPSGKAKVCKTFIPQFKSGWHLQPEPRHAACVRGFFSDMILVAGRKRGKAVIYKKQRYAHKTYHTVGKQKLYWEVFIS